MTDIPLPGHPAVREKVVQIVNVLVLADRNARICELPNDAGLAPSTLLNNLKKQQGI